MQSARRRLKLGGSGPLFIVAYLALVVWAPALLILAERHFYIDERVLLLFLLLAGLTALVAFVTLFPVGWFSVSAANDGLSFTNVKRLWSFQTRNFKGADIQEIELRKTTNYGYLENYSIRLRPREGSEQVLWEGKAGLTDRLAATVAEELSRAGFAVKLLKTDTGDGKHETTSWELLTPRPRTTLDYLIPGWILGLAGFGVRIATARKVVIVLAAIVLWLAGTWLYSKVLLKASVAREDKQSVWAYFFTWSLQFSLFYLIGVLAAGSVLAR